MNNNDLTIKIIDDDFSICQLSDTNIDINKPYSFLSKTDEEISLVCPTKNVPNNSLKVENEYRLLKIEGVLDFSLIGIISKISKILADNHIGIFVISTYNTDYVLIKKHEINKTISLLRINGYRIR